MRKKRIVVSGIVATVPMAGLAWHTLNYVHGLLDLGHDVVFVEDINAHGPAPGTGFVPSSSQAVAMLEDALSACERTVPYSYYSAHEKRYYGLAGSDLQDVLAKADAMICVSANARFPAERARPRKVVAIDTDPVFTQFRLKYYPDFLDYYRTYDAVATFGKLIGTPLCDLPTHGITWIATQQPVPLHVWEFSAHAGNASFTTLSGWGHDGGHFTFEGRVYRRGKDLEWLRVLDLPGRVSWSLEIAIDTTDLRMYWERGMPFATAQTFRDKGWRLMPPFLASLSADAYRRFIRSAAGEFTVAKGQYAAIPSGWFSDRSALFLASGKPVVTQETGFSEWLPTGEGLFAFRSVDEAASALNEIAHDYDKHARKAREIAERYFDAKNVLSDLLERVL